MNSRYTPAHITAELPQSLSPFDLGGLTVAFIEKDDEYFVFKCQLEAEMIKNSYDVLLGIIQTEGDDSVLGFSFKASHGHISVNVNADELSFNEPGRETIHQDVVSDLEDLEVEPQSDMIYCTQDFTPEIFQKLMGYFLQFPESKYKLTISHQWYNGMPESDTSSLERDSRIAKTSLATFIRVPGFDLSDDGSLYIIQQELNSRLRVIAGTINITTDGSKDSCMFEAFCIIVNGYATPIDIQTVRRLKRYSNVIVDHDFHSRYSKYQAMGLYLSLPRSIVTQVDDEETKNNLYMFFAGEPIPEAQPFAPRVPEGIPPFPFSQPIQSDEQIKHFMQQAEEYYRQQDSQNDSLFQQSTFPRCQGTTANVTAPIVAIDRFRPELVLTTVPGFQNAYSEPLLIVKSMVAKLGVAIAGIYDRKQEQFIAFCVLTYLGYQAIPRCCADEFKNFNNVIIGPESMMRDYTSMFERDGIKLLLPLSILDAAVDEESKRLLSTLFPSSYLVDYRKYNEDSVAENMVLNKLAAVTMRNSI